MNEINKPCVVSIAGSDSSGGAGIQADIKTISATGCYAASVITALTAQNTQGVQAILAVEPEFIAKQINSVFSDLEINSVKIGMLHNEAVIAVVASAIKEFEPPFSVLDPVMVAKNGCELLDENCINALKESLFSLVTLITPNCPEAEKLTGLTIKNVDDQQVVAKQLGDLYQVNVLIKGGHLEGEQSSDVLYLYEPKTHHWFHADRILSKNTHGTGCSLSSAIASYLAQGFNLIAAIAAAKDYLTKAIIAGRTLKIGRGCGPVDHFYFLGVSNDI